MIWGKIKKAHVKHRRHKDRSGVNQALNKQKTAVVKTTTEEIMYHT